MNSVFFVMAILGCGDGNGQCTEARVVPVRYETMAQCRAALPQQIARNTDIDYPTIGANCRSAGAQVALNDVKLPRR